MKHSYPLALGALSFVLASSLSAETLVQYNFTNGSGNSPSLSATAGTNVVTGNFARGSGIDTIGSSSTGNPDPRSIFVTGNQIDESISSASNDWVGFTISADSGYKLNLDSFSFSYAYTYENAGTTIENTATFEVRSSVDGFGSPIDSFTVNAKQGTSPTWATPSIGLTASNYQNLGSVEFRIYLADDGSQSTTSYLRLDTVTLSGVSSAIPEPSTYALMLGAVGLGVAASRRAKRAL